MRLHRLLAVFSVLLPMGCAHGTDPRAQVDETVCCITNHPYDLTPPSSEGVQPTIPPMVPPSYQPTAQPGGGPGVPNSIVAPPANSGASMPPANDVRTVVWLAPVPPGEQQPGTPPHFDLNIPAEIPGSEARRIEFSKDPATKQRQILQLFPPLPPLPTEPVPQRAPNGGAYTLADLQQIAAANSPTLRQAASDVEAARGNMIQANAYPNPTVSLQFTPSNDGSTPGADGIGIDQTIKTAGKLRLAKSAAEMALHNAELALRRARSDLSTHVRNAYFGLLVAKETVRVNKALAHFTDEVYRLQAELLMGGFAAPYEPAALRAQAYTARLGYKQSIQTYTYAWKQLVAAINVLQLPLSEVAGRIDANIPLYNYDAVLLYVLHNHTDALTALNGIDLARYNLKLAQVTPVPDVDVNMAVIKDFSLAPKQATPTLTLGVPLPIWDRNQGAIIAAESALVRAEEEPHRVQMNLTNTLATNYVNYKNNLDALEYYRVYILPDQVRTYRGTFDRRQIDPNASFGDLVSAQQTLSANVSSYLAILGQLWSSVVSVADLLETDDLFQLATPQAIPSVADLESLMPLPCCHPCAGPTVSGPNMTPLVVPPAMPATPAAPAEPIEHPQPQSMPPPQQGVGLPEPRRWEAPATDGAAAPMPYPPPPWATQQPPVPSWPIAATPVGPAVVPVNHIESSPGH